MVNQALRANARARTAGTNRCQRCHSGRTARPGKTNTTGRVAKARGKLGGSAVTTEGSRPAASQISRKA
jgi:hypothetical protein